MATAARREATPANRKIDVMTKEARTPVPPQGMSAMPAQAWDRVPLMGRHLRHGGGRGDIRPLNNPTLACRFLKIFSNEVRLQTLCLLADGEKSVGEMEAFLGIRQAALSQQLAYLRAENLVTTRRVGKSIRYSLTSDRVRAVLDVVQTLFCDDSCPETSCAMQRALR